MTPTFSLADGVLELKNTRADLLGGTVSGDWKIDFSGSEPRYESTGSAERIQAEKLGTLLKASLGSGTLALKYKLKMAGWDADTLSKSATAETDFTWSGGVLRISPDPRMPLRVLTGEGKAVLDKDGWTISACQWNTPTGIYQLSGTASRDSAIAFEFLRRTVRVAKVTGTLSKPQFGTAGTAAHASQT